MWQEEEYACHSFLCFKLTKVSLIDGFIHQIHWGTDIFCFSIIINLTSLIRGVFCQRRKGTKFSLHAPSPTHETILGSCLSCLASAFDTVDYYVSLRYFFLFPLVLWNTSLFILSSLFLFLNSPSTVFCRAPLLHTSQFWSNSQLSTWAFLLCTFTTTVISFTIMSLNPISDNDYQTYNSWLDLSSHLLSCLSHILIS